MQLPLTAKPSTCVNSLLTLKNSLTVCLFSVHKLASLTGLSSSVLGLAGGLWLYGPWPLVSSCGVADIWLRTESVCAANFAQGPCGEHQLLIISVLVQFHRLHLSAWVSSAASCISLRHYQSFYCLLKVPGVFWSVIILNLSGSNILYPFEHMWSLHPWVTWGSRPQVSSPHHAAAAELSAPLTANGPDRTRVQLQMQRQTSVSGKWSAVEVPTVSPASPSAVCRVVIPLILAMWLTIPRKKRLSSSTFSGCGKCSIVATFSGSGLSPPSSNMYHCKQICHCFNLHLRCDPIHYKLSQQGVSQEVWNFADGLDPVWM